jgi:nitrogen fixation protein NifX
MKSPETIRIAITTNDLVQVNASFASAQQIVTYAVNGSESEFVDCFQFRKSGGGQGRGKKDGTCWMMEEDADAKTVDRNQAKLDALDGCAMIFSLGLSDVHAVKINDIGIYPIKMEKPREISQVIDYVQKIINSANPPLWMRRALSGVRRGALDYANQVA